MTSAVKDKYGNSPDLGKQKLYSKTKQGKSKKNELSKKYRKRRKDKDRDYRQREETKEAQRLWAREYRQRVKSIATLNAFVIEILNTKHLTYKEKITFVKWMLHYNRNRRRTAPVYNPNARRK